MRRTDLSTPEVCYLLRLPFQTPDYWIRTGVIQCDTPAAGCGSRRRWTLRDLTQAQITIELRDNNCPPDQTATITALLRSHWTDADPEHAGRVLTRSLNDSPATWHPDLHALTLQLHAPPAQPEWHGLYIIYDARRPARTAAGLLTDNLATLTTG